MKKIAVLVASMIAVLGISVSALAPTPAYATCDGVTGSSNQVGCAACEAEEGSTWNAAEGKCNRGTNGGDLNGIIQTIINVMLFIIGILSVVMIIFGGIRYVTSAGNKTQVDNAKNTIIYAVVGLVVAIVAFALVQWIFSSLVK
jgi:hypothetical protein